jgi:hypothetical protein
VTGRCRVAHVGFIAIEGKTGASGPGPAALLRVVAGAQMRIGITTYLKPGWSGTVNSALELLSCSSIFTISALLLASTSIR